MVRGEKITGKRSVRKKVRSDKGSSDDSDEEYVVSDENRGSDDDDEYHYSSLDGCASEDSFDGFIVDEEEEVQRARSSSRSKAKNGIGGWRRTASRNPRKRGRAVYEDQEEEEGKEEEEEEFRSVRNANRSKEKNGICSWRRNASKNSRKRRRVIHAEQEEEEEEFLEEEEEEEEVEEEEEEEEEEEDEEEEEFQGVRAFNRSKVQNGVCGKQKNARKTSRKSGLITHADQLEEEEEEVEEDEEEKKEEVERHVDEEEVEEVEEEKEEGDGDAKDEDFECYEEDEDEDDDDEFTPDEEDFSDEEEEMSGRKSKNNGMKIGKARASLVSTRGRKRRSSRAAKKPFRNEKRKNGGFSRKVKCDSEDDFIDSDTAVTTTGRKKRSSRKRRRLLLSDSDCAPSGPSDFEYTISEEEREQVREAKKLCGRLGNNLRSSSLLINNEEVGVPEDQPLQKKPPGLKGKENIEEPQVRKGKEKVEDLKSEVVKQVCGICLSEEDRRRVRGVLNCCTHYFCFACIMEWAKVESRCPVCKQRFKTISKPARSTKGVDLREMVIQVPERDQVYQPSEEELRSYIDPYESVICSECHQGGDDGLMLLCDVCDSPAHTYCVGLGQEVPEGNWYCDGCRPVALGTSSSQAQETDPRVTIQSLPVRPPPVNVRESIDLNLISSPHAALNQGFGPLSSSRFGGVSPVSGGAPTLSERRWIHRQIQQLLSMDRMASTTGRTNGISAISPTSNLHSSQIDRSRQTATQLTRTEDVGTSYHTFFEERLRNYNVSPLMQNGALWPGVLGTPPVANYEQALQFSRSNIVPDGSSFPAVREEINFHLVQEQLQSMVTSHLKNLSQNIDLGHSTFMDIARSCIHTILAACGLEHLKSEVCTVPPPSVCPHIEMMAGGQSSLIKGCCSSCFDSFVGDVVKRILDTRISPQWLRLGL